MQQRGSASGDAVLLLRASSVDQSSLTVSLMIKQTNGLMRYNAVGAEAKSNDTYSELTCLY